MSIHSRPEEHGDRDPIAPVSPESGATMDPPSPRKPISGYAHLRKSNAPNEVALPARKWLSRLPHQVRPINLIGQYPRIVNRFAAAWDNPAAFGELATDLLYDFRGGRAGFPPEIVRELRVLREHYYVQPSKKT